MSSTRHVIPFASLHSKNDKAVTPILVKIIYLAAGRHFPQLWVSGTWIQPGAAMAVPVLCPAQSTHDSPTPLLAVGNVPLAFVLNIPRARTRTFHCSQQRGWQTDCNHRLILLVDWISRWPQEATDNSPAWQTSRPKSTSGVKATVDRWCYCASGALSKTEQCQNVFRFPKETFFFLI